MVSAVECDERSPEENKLSFVDPVALAGVMLILALCNCAKLFTSY
jgi:hypothetical protein